jgi:hypothetical protein
LSGVRSASAGRIAAFVRERGISRSSVYRFEKVGLELVRLGRMTFVDEDSFDRLVDKAARAAQNSKITTVPKSYRACVAARQERVKKAIEDNPVIRARDYGRLHQDSKKPGRSLGFGLADWVGGVSVPPKILEPIGDEFRMAVAGRGAIPPPRGALPQG